MSKQLPEYIAVEEVARRMGVHAATIRRWVNSGDERFGGRKHGGRVIVLRAPFERYMRGDDIPTPVIDLSTRRRRPRRRTS